MTGSHLQEIDVRGTQANIVGLYVTDISRLERDVGGFKRKFFMSF